MDPRLLEYYSGELTYIRELAAEFAQRYPKIGGRLGMNGIEVADPYVERLLEGFAFLTARVQLKMDAEFPRFSQRLLEMVYPNYMAPTPAMAVVEITPSKSQGNLADGFTVPRGSAMRSNVPRGELSTAEFRTAHEVTLWPLQVEAVQFGGPPTDVSLAQNQLNRQVKSSLRVKIKLTEAISFQQLRIDKLPFHIASADIPATRLYELLAGHVCGAMVCAPQQTPKVVAHLQPSAIELLGFSEEEALIPYEPRGFQGYRLLHEYFAFPQRFYFFSVNHLLEALHLVEGDTFELIILFDQQPGELDAVFTKEHLALFCTPVINLFTRRTDRIAITPERHEYHIVIDRTRPMDHEVFSVTEVTGMYAEHSEEQSFRPFYSSLQHDGGRYGAYYSLRRELRVLSDNARQFGPRTSYIGSEVFVSLVDQNEAPYRSDLRELAVEVLCTNRDLSLMLPVGAESDFTLTLSAPIQGIKVLRGPTRPRPSIANGDITWRLISHLGLNYLTLTDLDEQQGAAALRELMTLYADLADTAINKQIEGLAKVKMTPVTRRLPGKGPLVFGRGIDIELTIDELPFAGLSPIICGMVIEQFIARHVGLNTFIQMSLHSSQRGLLYRWPARFGKRPVA